ncbi:MAG: ISNCY family transposase [Synergistaceae bacterium]|nr:ISNCY family transposase [Synergistaceae bacterium]
MSREELKRVKVLERMASGSMSKAESASSLGITPRQLRRLKAKYEREGDAGLIHGNRGRKPQHALPDELKSKVLRLYNDKYYDSNFCHYSELLEEHENIRLSPSSIGRILKSSGEESKRHRRRKAKKHQPRERRAQAGSLWQTDATPYEWLGKEIGRFALHAVIDDATGIVTGAVFTRNECAEGYSIAMREGIEKYGIPLGLYSDRHTIFRSPKEKQTIDAELDGEQIPLSNFGKAMAELHIQHIKANTPQAKGRIERLWETLQDRLPVEFRLLGIKSIEEANEVLPQLIEKHNTKYSVSPAESGSSYMPPDKTVCLEHVFALRTARKIGGGNSVSYKNAIYVPVNGSICCLDSKTAVEIRETYSGEVFIWRNGQPIPLKKIERRPRLSAIEETVDESPEPKTKYKPSLNHPWNSHFRKLNLNNSNARVTAAN